MTPRLYENDECLQQSVNYVFQRTVKALDTTEIQISLPPKTECDCVKTK
ncbi:MAG TPA: hypothetical protein VII32_15780 [Thermoanaerobaculia bacterium]|jgi:hypothetical protein